MFKQLGVIWAIGLGVVFLTVLLGAGLVAVRVFLRLLPLVLVAGLLVWGVRWWWQRRSGR